MSVVSFVCVVRQRSLPVLITRSDESYRLYCVFVCDLETSWMRRPWPTGGLSRQKQNLRANWRWGNYCHFGTSIRNQTAYFLGIFCQCNYDRNTTARPDGPQSNVLLSPSQNSSQQQLCIALWKRIINLSKLPAWLGTAVAQWLRCCATNRKVAGSIPDGIIGIFHWHNPSDRTIALGSTQPLTEMSTRINSWE